MSKRRIISGLLLAAILLGAFGCSSGSGTKETTPAQSGDTPATTEAETVKEYDYQGKNYDGYTFTFLNYDAYVDTNLRLTPEELTGEALNDAMFERNKKVEEKLNIKLKEDQKSYTGLGGWGTSQTKLCEFVSTSIVAGDFLYDVANIPIYWKIGLMTEGYLLDLNTIPEIHLHEDYWDSALIDTLTVAGKSYLGSSPFTLMPLDLTWVLLFNQNMMDDLKLEYPYELVRSGKWTLDKFEEYVTKGTQLNGDASFDYSDSGKAIYGIAAHTESPMPMLTSCDIYFVQKDAKGELTVQLESERFYNAVEKLQRIFSKSLGHSTLGVTNPNAAMSEPSGYKSMFRDGRALFITAEIKTALEERVMEDDFGLLPMPKYDEAQAEYKASIGHAAMLTVPMLQKDVSRTGFVLDALSFESGEVMDTYYYTTVGQKGLRNKDSEEMLDIIRAGWTTEIGDFFSITTPLASQLQKDIRAENAAPASLVASLKSQIEGNVKTVVEAFAKTK